MGVICLIGQIEGLELIRGATLDYEGLWKITRTDGGHARPSSGHIHGISRV